MKVVLSRLALAELDTILAYIEERSPLGARNVEARMRRALDHIARYPKQRKKSRYARACGACRSRAILT
jgi:plasmid stabilization system protein ParE